MVTDRLDSEPQPASPLDSESAKFYEVVDGAILENPPMGAQESVLASFLQGLMDPIARSRRLGRVVIETLFLIDHTRNLRRRPDLAFVSDQRWHLKRRVPRAEVWGVVPDLAVEVISQSNTADAVAIKIVEYFQAGVRSVWVIYPVNNKVYVYDSATVVRILQVGDILEGGELLPGFQKRVIDLLRRGRRGARAGGLMAGFRDRARSPRFPGIPLRLRGRLRSGGLTWRGLPDPWRLTFPGRSS